MKKIIRKISKTPFKPASPPPKQKKTIRVSAKQNPFVMYTFVLYYRYGSHTHD